MTNNIEDRLDSELDPARRESAAADPELRDLTELASLVRANYEPPHPSVEGTARGKARLMAALAQELPSPASWAWPVWKDVLRGWLAAKPAQRFALSGTLALAVLLLGNGVVSLSADSLPGDPLYGLKRAQESFRYSLTFDDAQREELQVQFDGARARELRTARQQQRAIRAEVSGHIASIDGLTIVVNGISLAIPPHIADIGRFSIGDRVVVTVEYTGDDVMAVLDIQPANPLPGTSATPNSPLSGRTGTPSRLPTATRAQPSATPPDGRTVPAVTPLPGRTEVPSATRLPLSTPTPTRTEEPDETPQPATETPRPTETRNPTQTTQPTRTPTPNDSPTPVRTFQPTSPASATQTPSAVPTMDATETPRPTRTADPTETPRATRAP